MGVMRLEIFMQRLGLLVAYIITHGWYDIHKLRKSPLAPLLIKGGWGDLSVQYLRQPQGQFGKEDQNPHHKNHGPQKGERTSGDEDDGKLGKNAMNGKEI